MRILVVEDEVKVATFLKRTLEEEGFDTDLAHDGDEGIAKACESTYDLIIMDVMMPKKDGLTATREIRSKGVFTPVICLTAKDTPEDVVKGLESGCDDYLTKPFSFAELMARSRALLRRKNQARGAELYFADLRLDPVSHKVWRSGNELNLTEKEYGLLEYMMNNPNEVLTRTMIAEAVWDYTFDSFTNIIDVYVNYLRKKVDRDYPTKLIHTVRGVGYILKEKN
ncbi:two component transcriptional regulator, winged helix family [Malonomonas rubra DSM 5091]|uniref:Two component transcriptional regulator, winged helix family n=1 Tax=Malonomonas rubra DSM 5091 TaxID=1122189 RepID=A0A1M6MXS2_MALRU|nr:response regulator transcription factor [Malonomonas rubra]SHJ88184.1 two component transcriptional regulator, winged helix family [Malonomonas rubra DSM 5091]